jgi:hypothetical protein
MNSSSSSSYELFLYAQYLPTQLIDWFQEFWKWFIERLFTFKEELVDNAHLIREKIISFRLIPQFSILGVDVGAGDVAQFIFFYIMITRGYLKPHDLFIVAFFYVFVFSY